MSSYLSRVSPRSLALLAAFALVTTFAAFAPGQATDPAARVDAITQPAEPPSLSVLFQRLVAQARRFEDQANLNRASWYRYGVANWDKNYLQQNYDREKTEEISGRTRPKPSFAVHFTANPETYGIEGPFEGPELVTLAVPLPTKPEGPPEGFVEFGPRVYGWHVLAYYAGNTNVPVGTETEYRGERFQLVQLGVKNSIIYRLLWELI